MKTCLRSWSHRSPLIRRIQGLRRRLHLQPLPRTLRGWRLYLRVQPARLLPKALSPYAAWLYWNRPSSSRTEQLREDMAALTVRPLFSVLLPVFNTPPALLEAALASVLQQIYPTWELVIVDDGSTEAATQATLARWAQRDPRIRLLHEPVNGNISRATNRAAAAAQGNYFVLLDHDDLLTDDALAQVALYLAAHPACDWLYSDEDLIDMAGQRSSLRFKPNWSPEQLLAYCYVGHLVVMRAELWRQLGGLRVGFEGAQDYDLFLRASEQSSQVGHIAQILYHWRTAPGSTATRGDAKPQAIEAGRRAVAEALARRGLPCTVVQPAWAKARALGVYTPLFPDDGPSVAIIIPTKNQRRLLQACLESLDKTTYTNYRIYVIDNESDQADTLTYLATLPTRPQANGSMVTVWRIPNPGAGFNYAHINNVAATRVRAEFLLFLNSDVVVSDPRWLSQMVGYLRLAGVGAVGARLLFPNGRVQHAGVLHGLHQGGVGHAFKGINRQELGYLLQAQVSCNYSAVTAACLLTPRACFLACGGFDAATFGVAYNDVDYCARLRAQGLRIVYAPVELYHHEGATRGYGDAPAEAANLRVRYGSGSDPYYNPHLRLEGAPFALRAGIVDWGSTNNRPQRPIRALFVSHNLNWEGAPLCQFELIRGLQKAGVIDPILFSPQEGSLRAAYQAAGIPVLPTPTPPLARHDLAQYLAQVIRQHGVEVLHANTLETAWAIMAATQTQTPTLWNIHESEDWITYFQRYSLARPVEALQAFALPYRVIFVSQASHTVWQPLERLGNFCVIHNGFDDAHFQSRLGDLTRAAARQQLGIADDQVVLLAMGTVCARKRQHDLVRAFAELPAATVAQTRLLIVGDRPSPYSDQLHSLVAGLPPARRGQVTIRPETSSTAPFWRAADLFVCTAQTESFPRSLQEAMACGLPMITTPVYGIREMVRPGINAEFYPPGQIKALTAAIQRLITDETLRQRYAGHAPTVLAGSLSFAAMLAEYAKLFGEARLTAAMPFTPQPVPTNALLDKLTAAVNGLRGAVTAAQHKTKAVSR